MVKMESNGFHKKSLYPCTKVLLHKIRTQQGVQIWKVLGLSYDHFVFRFIQSVTKLLLIQFVMLT